MKFVTAFVLLFLCIDLVVSKSFTVDYKKDCFLKDGKPFRYVSGSIHYFRVLPELWHDRMYKMKMAGFNAVQTYIEWNHHEPEPGTYYFADNYNLTKYLQTAASLDMVVILRLGPFIDAERDMGGLPYWLLRENPLVQLRTSDPTFLKYVDKWFGVILKVIEPFLYSNGGPVVMLQVENEYGSSYCDAQYKSHLRDTVRKNLKSDVILFTTDGDLSSALACGKIDQVFSTVDFGPGTNVTSAFEMLRWTQASGPLVNSEFYPGWLDHWGAPHANVSSESTVKTLTEMLKANASVNVYMFHGGTSFGFTAGSNLGGSFQACPTSYDYDAPLNEAGDPTPKYYAMREAVGKFLPLPPGPVPKPTPKMKLGSIQLKRKISLWDYTAGSTNFKLSTNPLSFEDLKQPYGFVLYGTNITFNTTDPTLLTVTGIADRGYVYVDKKLQGILSREQKIESMPLRRLTQGQKLEILVENQGRVCFGPNVNDRKGIFQNVTLGSKVLLNWEMVPVNLETTDLKSVNKFENNIFPSEKYSVSAPAFYSGSLTLGSIKPMDTFLRLDGWHKGVAFLNGFNLGRYWPVTGPQVTLYTPGVLFKPLQATNEILLLELEHAPCDDPKACTVQFVDKHVVNGTTPTQ